MTDLLIVGQGLAGTSLAWAARAAGLSCLVVDREDAVTASRIAAGLVTPITGLRLAKSWRLDEMWPAAVQFYRQVEGELGERVFDVAPAVRLLMHATERKALDGKIGTLTGMVARPKPPVDAESFAAPFGDFAMTPAARLDVPRYLALSRMAFRSRGEYLTADLDLSRDVELRAASVDLPRLGVSASRLIFCQGIAGRANPWFGEIPFNAAKGEILTLHIPELQETRVIHGGVWLLPQGDCLFRAGATYQRGDLTDATTRAGRAEIELKLKLFLRRPFQVVDHQAAVRPILVESQPVVRRHSEFPQLGFFNGLGSKGALLAPRFAVQMLRE